MDEMTLVRDLGLETPLPDATRLAPARARLLAEARPRRGFKIVTGTAILAAAAAAVLIIAVPHHQATPTSTPSNPTTFLYAAADAVLTQPDVVPRPDQYVYVDETMAGGKRSESWYSIDGKHDGLYPGPEHVADSPPGPQKIPGCPHGKPDAIPEQGEGCRPDPHYLPDMPTSAGAMVAWLRERNPNDNEVTITNGIAKDIMYLSETYYLRSSQRAALYRAAAQIPGLRLVPGQKTLDGHVGIGVTWEYANGAIMWIFDPKTHVLLGAPTTTSHLALVDKVGQRP